MATVSSKPVGSLAATLTRRQLHIHWAAQQGSKGIVRLWHRGRCIVDQQLPVAKRLDDTSISVEIELCEEVQRQLVASCYVELQFDDGFLFRGWVDVTERLNVAPQARQQLTLLEDIASDPANCKEDDLVRFVAALHRSLASGASGAWYTRFTQPGKTAEDYEELPIQRSSLLENDINSWNHPASMFNSLLNRTLDGAIRDLRFFGRDDVKRKTKPVEPVGVLDTSKQTGVHATQSALPPKIEEVMRQLFGQLATAFADSKTSHTTAALIAQIPTCIKALAFVRERWLPQRGEGNLTSTYFEKVVFACLAPGMASLLRREGAIRRLSEQDRARLGGPQEFETGIAMLEAYLLLLYFSGRYTRPDVLKDLYDVICELPRSSNQMLQAAGHELWRIQQPADLQSPDLLEIREQMQSITGEMANLRASRAALIQLVATVGATNSDKARVTELIETATNGNLRWPRLDGRWIL